MNNLPKPTLFLLLLLVGSLVYAQKTEPKVRVPDPDHIITSKITGRKYDLFISFPAHYSNKDTLRYPVLYVMDGIFYYPTLHQARQSMDLSGELEDVIIVGVSSGIGKEWLVNRTSDYTPTLSPADDRNTEKFLDYTQGTLKSGEASKFLACIKEEIVPFIDNHYKTNSDRGIAGHSFGGLFAAYCYITSPEYFSRYGINSPSFWWDGKKLLNESKALLDKYPSLKTKVYVSVGEREGGMVPTMMQFTYDLKARKKQGVFVEWTLYEKETHTSVTPAALSRSLFVLYGK